MQAKTNRTRDDPFASIVRAIRPVSWPSVFTTLTFLTRQRNIMRATLISRASGGIRWFD